jgi:hypothetical protein
MTLDFALAGMFGVICLLLLADLARGQHPERRVSVGRENAGPAPGSTNASAGVHVPEGEEVLCPSGAT